jgi:chromatin structure-remodeling complex subunit RSC9
MSVARETPNLEPSLTDFPRDRTTFDPEGKVSGRRVSLHRLYKRVMEEGGYDVVSTHRPSDWRRLIHEFGLSGPHDGYMTFQLKTVYYRNLA